MLRFKGNHGLVLLSSLLMCTITVPAAHAQGAQGSSVESFQAQGRAYEELGKYNEAERAYTESVREAEKLGSQNPKLISALDLMGHFCYDRGDFGKSAQYYRRELDIVSRLTRPEDKFMIEVTRNLAKSLMYQGQLNESEDLYRRVLETNQRILQKAEERNQRNLVNERGAVATSLDDMAFCLRQAGSLGQASVYEKQAVRVRSQLMESN
jgi:tetratricopeptide (TPR) repeat protein